MPKWRLHRWVVEYGYVCTGGWLNMGMYAQVVAEYGYVCTGGG